MISATLILSVPTTILSGFIKSFTAVPSFKNSGFETTSNSIFSFLDKYFFTSSFVPIGTVDFKIKIL